ncbi:uncharacterized protein [Epargyreus clarus]|uniref:uncharacterized protein n=1 Tax=Epargyreus clarus TaxID=520877 RepID=UPI003C2F5647
MKACAFVFLFVFCYAECRKAYVPLDKNANLAFINMESGGMRPGAPPANQPAAPIPTPTKPANSPPASPTKPGPPSPVPTQKPVVPVVPVTSAPAPKPVPTTQPPQIQPKPVNPAPAASPITTPGPGSVKQLINFYDSQGKASPIRPYSYSQAVKQG